MQMYGNFQQFAHNNLGLFRIGTGTPNVMIPENIFWLKGILVPSRRFRSGYLLAKPDFFRCQDTVLLRIESELPAGLPTALELLHWGAQERSARSLKCRLQ